MGAPSQPIPLPFNLKEGLCKLTVRNGINNGGWRVKAVTASSPSRVSMKRRLRARARARLEACRRSGKGFVRRVKTLKSLVPNSEATGLDGLFRDTADYILALQMKVRVMQVLVDALSSGPDEEDA